jgi:hypothetical protein
VPGEEADTVIDVRIGEKGEIWGEGTRGSTIEARIQMGLWRIRINIMRIMWRNFIFIVCVCLWKHEDRMNERHIQMYDLCVCVDEAWKGTHTHRDTAKSLWATESECVFCIFDFRLWHTLYFFSFKTIILTFLFDFYFFFGLWDTLD